MQEEAQLSDWKRQLERDVENLKAKANRHLLQTVRVCMSITKKIIVKAFLHNFSSIGTSVLPAVLAGLFLLADQLCVSHSGLIPQ